MIKYVLSIWLICFCGMFSLANHPLVSEIRSGFVKAAQEKDHRQGFLNLIEANSEVSTFQKAYTGAAKTLMAECSYTPWTKYTLFKEGTALIEAAISAQPKNAEFRYLRFLVQFNAPEFLSYDKQLRTDYNMIKRHILQSPQLETWMEYFVKFEEMNRKEINARTNAQ